MDDAVTFHWLGEPRNVPNHFPEFIVNSSTIQCLAQEVCSYQSSLINRWRWQQQDEALPAQPITLAQRRL
jgi:hypothetical protein